MGSTAAATRDSNCCSDPHDPALEARKLTDNPAVIHDFGAWSPDATRIAYAANERDEAHFDVYVQDIASGARQCVYQGHNMVSVSGFRPMARSWRCFSRPWLRRHVAVAARCGIRRCADIRIAEHFQKRPLVERWSHLIGADRSRRQRVLRLCRLDPDSGDVSIRQ
jgi:hypothetical protein